MSAARRTLVVGWSSVVHGEATAGDVLSMRAAAGALAAAGERVDLAWSPVMALAAGPGALVLDEVDPTGWTHLVWACGPLHGAPVEEVAARFAAARRIAVGVSVVPRAAGPGDDGDPAGAGGGGGAAAGGGAGGWEVLARDAPGAEPVRDLAAGPATLAARAVRVCARTEAARTEAAGTDPAGTDPAGTAAAGGGGGPLVVGVCSAPGQAEYGERRRHGAVARVLDGWLEARGLASGPGAGAGAAGGVGAGASAAGGVGAGVVAVAVDTRLDPRGWGCASTPEGVLALLGRCDAVVSTRLHGLVLALALGVPVVAVDPVAGGGKVSAQGRAWGWPVLAAEELLAGPADAVGAAALDAALAWATGPQGRAAAAAAAAQAPVAGAEQLAELVRRVREPR